MREEEEDERVPGRARIMHSLWPDKVINSGWVGVQVGLGWVGLGGN